MSFIHGLLYEFAFSRILSGGALLFQILTIIGTSPAKIDAESQQIIDRHIAMTGSKSAFFDLKSITRKGQMQVFSEEGQLSDVVSYRTDIIYPLKLREELKGKQFIVDRGTDGSLFWEWHQDRYQEVKDESLLEYLRSTARIANRDLLWIQNEFEYLEVTNDLPSWAGSSQCLRGKKSDSETGYICFDTASGLLVAKGQDDEYRLTAQWTKVGKVKIPFHLTHYRNGKKIYEIQLTSANANHGINLDRFQIPTTRMN